MISGFIVKKPDSKRRTFQILPYSRVNRKNVYASPIQSPALDALNESLKRGTINAAQALIEIKTNIMPELKRIKKIPEKVAVDSMLSEHNLKVFAEFWRENYRRKKLERPSVARDEFHTALRFFEPLSLHASTVDQVQDHWDKKLKGTRHKRYGNRINQLLRYLRRGFEIETDRATVPELKWVTWEGLEKINEHVNNPVLRDLYRALYGTGARLGEMFAITLADIRPNGSIYISKQIDRDGELKPYTKNKNSHDTIILDEAIEAVKRWASVENKLEYRKCCQHPLIDAARMAFPSTKSKQISPHKLRHSYVKQMLTLGVPLDRVAQFLGDRVSTLETTYRQWVVSDSEVDHVRSIMASGYKRLKKV